MTKRIGRDHILAQDLWSTEIYKSRILASMIDTPDMVTEDQMGKWVKD